MSATIKRGTARRPVQPKRRKPPKVSTLDRMIAALPVSEATLRRIATWSIMGLIGARDPRHRDLPSALPGMVGTAVGEGIGQRPVSA